MIALAQLRQNDVDLRAAIEDEDDFDRLVVLHKALAANTEALEQRELRAVVVEGTVSSQRYFDRYRVVCPICHFDREYTIPANGPTTEHGVSHGRLLHEDAAQCDDDSLLAVTLLAKDELAVPPSAEQEPK